MAASSPPTWMGLAVDPWCLECFSLRKYKPSSSRSLSTIMPPGCCAVCMAGVGRNKIKGLWGWAVVCRVPEAGKVNPWTRSYWTTHLSLSSQISPAVGMSPTPQAIPTSMFSTLSLTVPQPAALGDLWQPQVQCPLSATFSCQPLGNSLPGSLHRQVSVRLHLMMLTHLVVPLTWPK